MPAVEINSSFYRPHASVVYAKWAASSAEDFRFAAKMPGAITHELRLRQPSKWMPLLRRFVEQTSGLGTRLGPVLVQLPPSLEFDLRIANKFFDVVRSEFAGSVVCEPRHATWFTGKANDLLVRYQIARAAADPVRAPGADLPAGWSGLVYYRLHGSPRLYWSSYDDRYIRGLAERLSAIPSCVEVWVIFDNTASGAALQDALRLAALLHSDMRHASPRGTGRKS